MYSESIKKDHAGITGIASVLQPPDHHRGAGSGFAPRPSGGTRRSGLGVSSGGRVAVRRRLPRSGMIPSCRSFPPIGGRFAQNISPKGLHKSHYRKDRSVAEGTPQCPFSKRFIYLQANL